MPIGSRVQKPREEHQTMLAKLLAKENIIVRFGNYSTAFFEPRTRILGMPMWNSESKQVSDLLVGHEVGHALYTPQDGIEKFQKRFPHIPFDICNVIEDVRIERMIQSTYPGLVHSFREGYRSFLAKDLFKINGVDLSKLSVADRINLHAKIGHLVKVPLSAEERVIYDAAYSAKTFDDVLDVVERLYDLVKNSKDQKQPEAPGSSEKQDSEKQESSGTPQQAQSGEAENGKESKQGESGGSGDESKDSTKSEKDSSDKKESEKSDLESGDETERKGSTSSTDKQSDLKSNKKSQDESSGGSEDNEVNSDDISSNKKGDDQSEISPDYSPNMSDNFSATHQREFEKGTTDMQERITTYQVNVPTVAQMMNAVTPLKTVLESRRFDPCYNDIMTNSELNLSYGKFKESTKKHTQVLIKEFERRKAAYQYSRARQSTNGTLNVNRLHAYKYEDQIFRSVTTLAEAKNHGMAFFIDYSGSMSRTIGSVIEQTIQLVTFCKAVGIPFIVYGFTSQYFGSQNRPTVVYSPGYSIEFDHTNVFEILNSSLKKSEFDKCLKEMYAMSWYRSRLGTYGYHASSSYVLFNSQYEVFGGTPLVETVIIASELVKQFRKKNAVQKMSVTFLTDGDPCLIHMHDNVVDREYRKNTENWCNGYEMRFGGEVLNWSTRHPKGAMAAVIRAFRNITQSTVIGYFVADNQRSFKSHCIDAMRNTDREVGEWAPAAEKFKAATREIRKNDGIFAIKNGGGYDMLFAFDSRDALTIDSDEEFKTDVDIENLDNASAQNKLAKEFIRFSSSKKSSRIFVHKFAEMIS